MESLKGESLDTHVLSIAGKSKSFLKLPGILQLPQVHGNIMQFNVAISSFAG